MSIEAYEATLARTAVALRRMHITLLVPYPWGRLRRVWLSASAPPMSISMVAIRAQMTLASEARLSSRSAKSGLYLCIRPEICVYRLKAFL